MPATARLGLRQERFRQRLCSSSPHHIIQHDTRLAARLRKAMGIQVQDIEQIEYVSSSRELRFPGAICAIPVKENKEESDREAVAGAGAFGRERGHHVGGWTKARKRRLHRSLCVFPGR